MFPLAMEGALKLKEISYIHAEGYAAGELKHGRSPWSTRHADHRHRAAGRGVRKDRLEHAGSRGARRAGHHDRAEVRARSTRRGHSPRRCPECHSLIAPLIYAIPVQLLAYYTAVQKGTDVDQPRNLAKSVTVE
jgi:glucosamine--fructose-6-phosphate aminotransferase (isomerizing)